MMRSRRIGRGEREQRCRGWVDQQWQNQDNRQEEIADVLRLHDVEKMVNLGFDTLVMAAVEVAGQAYQRDSAHRARLAPRTSGLAHDVWRLTAVLAEFAEREGQVAA